MMVERGQSALRSASLGSRNPKRGGRAPLRRLPKPPGAQRFAARKPIRNTVTSRAGSCWPGTDDDWTIIPANKDASIRTSYIPTQGWPGTFLVHQGLNFANSPEGRALAGKVGERIPQPDTIPCWPCSSARVGDLGDAHVPGDGRGIGQVLAGEAGLGGEARDAAEKGLARSC